MNKSFIEKRLEKEVEKQLQAELRAVRSLIQDNPIFDALKVTVGEGEIGLRDAIPYYDDLNKQIEFTKSNIKKVIENRREKLLQENTDELFRKLEGIQYIFNQM